MPKHASSIRMWSDSWMRPRDSWSTSVVLIMLNSTADDVHRSIQAGKQLAFLVHYPSLNDKLALRKGTRKKGTNYHLPIYFGNWQKRCWMNEDILTIVINYNLISWPNCLRRPPPLPPLYKTNKIWSLQLITYPILNSNICLKRALMFNYPLIFWLGLSFLIWLIIITVMCIFIRAISRVWAWVFVASLGNILRIRVWVRGQIVTSSFSNTVV